MMEESSEKHIRGMTHPKRIFIAANNMWKRRGAISATMKSNWVERLFVLTESSLFWFERGGEGNDGLGAQHGRVELRHIRSIVPTQTSSTSTTMDELERHGEPEQHDEPAQHGQQCVRVQRGALGYRDG